MQVHLAHFRGDYLGRTVIPPRINGNWQIIHPRTRHVFRSQHGEHRSRGPCLYLIPPGMAYAIEMERYTHYSVHFSNRGYRGYEAMAAQYRTCSDAGWPRTALPAALAGLTLLDRTWSVLHPIGDAADILLLFHALLDAFNRGDRFGASAALLQLLLGLVAPVADDPLARRLKPFADHLAMRFHEERGLADLARDCGLSRSQLHRLVKERYGRPPRELIIAERMRLACQLLERGTGVAAVAAACGFADQFYFSRLFRRRLGRAPSAWGSSPPS